MQIIAILSQVKDIFILDFFSNLNLNTNTQKSQQITNYNNMINFANDQNTSLSGNNFFNQPNQTQQSQSVSKHVDTSKLLNGSFLFI